MDDRVLVKLEFNRILEMLADKAHSMPGRESALDLKPEIKISYVRRLLSETLEAESVLMREPSAPIVSFSNISSELLRLKAGASLSCGELLRVLGVMKAAKRAYNSIKRQETGENILPDKAENLFFSDLIISELDKAIENEDALADSASHELFNIRKKIIREHDGIREKLDSIIRSAQHREHLQDAIVTMRNGRYVVPVKQEHRRNVAGLVHDQSSSGATVFIEPMEVVEANNRLRELEMAEAAEIERILRDFSDRLREYREQLHYDLEILTELDVIFAKASLASSMKASPPKVTEESILIIKNGRHPLIDAKKVVPVSLAVGEGSCGLIITGPNTGGKTVTLKLTGLLCLMAQCGMFVPADGGTTLPVFTGVYADIGDEQSIAQSLSTFSSHMTNITRITRAADGNSLVLLDELGAGTDPAEGAALAMAILEELAARGSLVLATTHYSEIKAFATASDRYENASMEFDIKTLSPTYKLIMGIPGVSNAFEISKKLGLDERIIENARRHMSEETVRFEELISEAHKKAEQAFKKEQQAESYRRTAQSIRDKSDAELKKAEEKSQKIIDGANEKALKILKEAREESERIIKELKEAKAVRQEDINAARRELSGRIEDTSSKLRTKKQFKSAANPADISAGDTVLLISHGIKALVLKEPKGDSVYVQAGALKMNVPLSEVEPAKPDKAISRTSGIKRTAAAAAGMETDVRGMSLDEAVIEVDRYLDEAFLSGLNEVYIIHGKGTGVLRSGLRDFLKKHAHVEEFRSGRFGEGETGVTVVTLRKR